MFGVAPALLIDCAVQIHEGHYSDEDQSLSLDDFSRALGAPISESAPVLHAMVAEGFFEQRDGQRFAPTQKLGQLALAKISSGISRTEAEALLGQIERKAEWINQRPNEFGYRVCCIAVFGSYLSSKTVLGDLDIGVAVEEIRESQIHAGDGDIYARIERSMAARRRTLKALRLRQPRKISIHEMSELMNLDTRYRLIFGALVPPHLPP